MGGMDDTSPADRRTLRRRRGDEAEALAARHLAERGWTILATQLRVGRDEVDLLALEPGPRPTIVVVEVRSRSDARYGVQEERVDARKLRCLYRAAAALRVAGPLADGTLLPRGPWRVDLVSVDLAAADGSDDRRATARVRHLRGLIPP